jgi:hypothetical protein
MYKFDLNYKYMTLEESYKTVVTNFRNGSGGNNAWQAENVLSNLQK